MAFRQVREPLGALTKAQTDLADRFTEKLCEHILGKDKGSGGHMDQELRPTQTYDYDAMRVVEINRGTLQYSVEIYVKRTDK